MDFFQYFVDIKETATRRFPYEKGRLNVFPNSMVISLYVVPNGGQKIMKKQT